MRPLRTVFHGLRHEHGPGKLASVRKLPGDFEVVGVVDDRPGVSPTWHANWSFFDGLPLMSAAEALAMPDVDVVFVETANGELVEAARPWAERGVAMHLDKPTGEKHEPFRELVALCRAKNVPLQLGYMFRANPAIRFCRKVVADGVLGKVFHVEADMDHDYGDDDYQRYVSTFHAGIFYNLCCHLVDFVVPMVEGDMVRSSLAVGAAPGDPPEWRNRCSAMMEWPEATVFLRSCSRNPGGIPHRRLRIDGTNGTLELDPIERFDGQQIHVQMFLGRPAGDYVAGRHDFAFGPQLDRYVGQLSELARIVRGEIPNPVALYDHDLKVHDVLLRTCFSGSNQNKD